MPINVSPDWGGGVFAQRVRDNVYCAERVIAIQTFPTKRSPASVYRFRSQRNTLKNILTTNFPEVGTMRPSHVQGGNDDWKDNVGERHKL